MPDYTAWPVEDDVYALLDQVGLNPTGDRRPDPDITSRLLAAVAAEITRRTHRQFVAASATRYFDGSGTGEQEVDEIITLASAGIVGLDGTASLELTNARLRTDNTYPNTIIEIFQTSLPALGFGTVNRFPQGRQNIEVTGTWGYGATIPADLWEAAAQEVAGRTAAQLLFQGDGRLSEWQEADVREKYLLQLPGEAAGWHGYFEDRVKAYTRPVDRNIRRWKAPMI